MDTNECSERHTKHIVDLKSRGIAKQLSLIVDKYLLYNNLFIPGNPSWVYSVITINNITPILKLRYECRKT